MSGVGYFPWRWLAIILPGNQTLHLARGDSLTATAASLTPKSTKRQTCAAVHRRAAGFFDRNGIPRVEQVISDNAFAYRKLAAVKDAVALISAGQRFIKSAGPWTNGKVERLNRTLANEWAYQQKYATIRARAAALAPWLNVTNVVPRYT